MTDKTVVSECTDLTIWSRDFMKAQRNFLIRKIHRKLKAQKELYELVESFKPEVDSLCKIFKV